jgi:hypothetical protein
MKVHNNKFFPMVQALESIISSANDVMELIRLIDENEFNELRSKVIDCFGIETDSKFEGEFGDEVEFGDISDVIQSTTFSLYPQSTDMMKDIDEAERKIWCEAILSEMDRVAQYE